MAFVKVASLASLPPGSLTEVTLGDDSYAICNVGGELHALDGVCPHAGGPLGQGNLQDNMVICPWHEWAYDCRTGESDYDPAVKLNLFPVQVWVRSLPAGGTLGSSSEGWAGHPGGT